MRISSQVQLKKSALRFQNTCKDYQEFQCYLNNQMQAKCIFSVLSSVGHFATVKATTIFKPLSWSFFTYENTLSQQGARAL